MPIKPKVAGAYVAPVGMLTKKAGAYTAIVGAFDKVAGAYQRVDAVTQPYMIATNRFALATDFGTGDGGLNASVVGTTSGASNVVAFTSYKGSVSPGCGLQVGAKVTSSGGIITGGSETTITAFSFTDATSGTLTLSAPFTLTGATITQSAEYASGSGVESTGRYHRHRRLFATTFAVSDARLLLSNSVQKVEGIVGNKCPFLVQRLEIRKVLAITPGAGVTSSTLVGAPLMGGANSHLMTAGENVWTDGGGLINLEANSLFVEDIWWQVDLGNVFPANTTFNLLPGESSGSSVSNFSGAAMGATGSSSAANGSTFSSSMIVGKGWDGSAVTLIVGDSREDLTNMVAAILTRDVGHASIAYGSATGGSMNYLEASRYSTGTNVLTVGGSGPAVAGTNVYGVFDWIAARMAQLGQTRAPFQFIHSAIGANTIAGQTTLSQAQNVFAAAVAKARSLWPGIPWVQETIMSMVNATNNSGFTDDVNITPLATQWGISGYIQAFNTWVMAGGGGLFNLGIDVAAAVRSSTNYYAPKTDGFTATVITAIIANNTGTVTLSAAPALGTAIVFEPGVANVDTGYIVYAIRQNADGINFDMDLAANNRAPVYKKVTKAHAAGVTVKGATFPDGIHQAHKGSLDEANVIITAKPQVTPIAIAYNGV